YEHYYGGFFTKSKLNEPLFHTENRVELVFKDVEYEHLILVEDQDKDGILIVHDVLDAIYQYFHRTIDVDDPYFAYLVKCVEDNPEECEILSDELESIRQGQSTAVYNFICTELDNLYLRGIKEHNGRFFLDTELEIYRF